jgi:hypothetical protein
MCILTLYFTSSSLFNNNKQMSSEAPNHSSDFYSLGWAVDANLEATGGGCSRSSFVGNSALGNFLGSSVRGSLRLALSLVAHTLSNWNRSLNGEYSILQFLFNFLIILSRASAALSVALFSWSLVGDLVYSLSCWNKSSLVVLTDWSSWGGTLWWESKVTIAPWKIRLG